MVQYACENGFVPSGLTYSPVTGAKGNIEYLLYLTKPKECVEEEAGVDGEDLTPDADALTGAVTPEQISKIVDSSHAELEK